MAQLINDPRTDQVIDVTGWNLDDLDDILTDLHADQQLEGVLGDYELEPAQLDAIAGPYGIDLSQPRPRGYYVFDADVREATDRYREIVEEAIFVRDRDAALAALAAGQPLTAAQGVAYDRYIQSISEQASH